MNAQNKDSLFKVATKLPVGTRVVKATLDLALLYLATEPDSAISWSSKAIELAKTAPKAEKWLTNGWNSLG